MGETGVRCALQHTRPGMLGANILGEQSITSTRRVASTEFRGRQATKAQERKEIRCQKSEIRRTRDPQIGGRGRIREICEIRGLMNRAKKLKEKTSQTLQRTL